MNALGIKRVNLI